MATSAQKAKLEEIATERLSKKINASIDNLDVDVWVQPQSGIRLSINGGTISVSMNYRISAKRLWKWVGSAAAVLAGVTGVLRLLLPILVDHFSKATP